MRQRRGDWTGRQAIAGGLMMVALVLVAAAPPAWAQEADDGRTIEGGVQDARNGEQIGRAHV